MRLLIFTQAVDGDDPVLGFFHGWIGEFSRHFERITVVCLKEGTHTLPSNVRVHSLGKDLGVSRITYILNFYRYLWMFRRQYDAVFVHMNQEYVLLGGLFWKLFGKRVYLWRNHYKGSVLTDIAAMFCTKVFCTSKSSYTARYAKAALMPVGVDTERFKPTGMERRRSALSLGRVAPSKRIEVLIDALALLAKRGLSIPADIYGDALPKDARYRTGLIMRAEARGLKDATRFHRGIPNDETPEIYGAHELFVNCSRSGMYDKTIFEALACGALVIAASRDFQEIAGEEFGFSGDAASLAEKMQRLLSLSEVERERFHRKLAALAERHSLKVLGERLVEEMS